MALIALQHLAGRLKAVEHLGYLADVVVPGGTRIRVAVDGRKVVQGQNIDVALILEIVQRRRDAYMSPRARAPTPPPPGSEYAPPSAAARDRTWLIAFPFSHAVGNSLWTWK